MENGQQPLNIILLGDPAAGKATHGAFIAKKFNMYDLDMGRELRSLSKNPVSRKKYRFDETLEKGKMTPTKIVRQILQDRMSAVPASRGLLLNGTPKMIGEAKLVTKWLKEEKRSNIIFIYLSIPLKETVARMTGRKEYFKGKFSKRPDDNNQALKNRIVYYQKNISEVVTYFKTKYPFVKISSLGSVKEARKKLLDCLNKYE